MGQPSHSASHDVASFWSWTDGECQRQYAEKIDCNLFTIAHVEKFMRKMRGKAYREQAFKDLVETWSVPSRDQSKSRLMKLVTLSPSKTARENTSSVAISRPSTHAHALVIRIENR